MAKERSRERAGEFRKKAEKILAADPQAIRAIAPADIQKLIHDLNVHQIELEMQNEELRRVQLELEETRDKYLDLYDFAPTGYFTLDRNNLIVEVNLAGSELLGSEKQRLIGTPFTASISADSQDAFYFHYREVLKTGLKVTYELKMLKADGTPFYAQLISLAIPEKDGNINHYRTAVIDITERKQAEEKLKQSLEELTRSNNELQHFAYIASHDLQEPLRMVASYVQLLERRYKDKLDPDANDFINFAIEGTKRMQNLINDLLAYSRVGSRARPFQPVNLEDVLGIALTNLTLAIKESRAEVTHGPLPTVLADEGQIAQVFQNLLSNAVKFRGNEPPRVYISAEQKESEWIISIADNGIGIEPQYFERIFDLFQRLHGQEYPGTGAGLSIAKRIVERHGGRIWVESQPGQGSTFYFSIPLKGEKQI